MAAIESAAGIQWHLRVRMARAGMFQTTDLIEPLRQQGVELSREQVFRLVTKPPERLSIAVLAALCRIFECTPNDLIEVESRRASKPSRASSNGPARELPELRTVPARIHRPQSGV